MKKEIYTNAVSFITAILLVFLSAFSVSMPVAMATDAADGDAMNENINLLKSLGIDVPSFESADEIVTRAEFVYVLMQTVGCNAPAGGELCFGDVKLGEYYANALIYAVNMGIVSEGDSFYPYRAVTYHEAYKMTVASLGRAYMANVRGGYPYGYLSVANDCGISDGLSPGGDGALSRYDFYALVSNFLEAPLYEVTHLSGDSAVMSDSQSVMERYFDVYINEGIISGDEFTSLYNPTSCESEGCVLIDNTVYKCNFRLELGLNAKAYVKKPDSGSLDEIIFVRYTGNKIVESDTSDISVTSSSSLEYEDENGKLKSIRFENVYAVLYNGKSSPKILLSDLARFDARLEFADNDSDGRFDVIKIWDATEIYVDFVNTEDKYIAGKNLQTAELADSPCKKYYVIKDGVYVTLEDIPNGCIASCCVSEDGLLVTVFVSTASVYCKINGYSSDGRTLVTDKAQYRYSESFERYYKSLAVSGSEGTLLFSVRGVAEAFVSESKSRMEYGYVIGVSTSSGLSSDVKIKLCTEKSKIEVFEINDKIRLNGNSAVSADAARVLAPDGTAIEQLIRYSTDSDGKINVIDTQDKKGFLSGSESDDDNLTLYEFPSGLTGNVSFLGSTSIVFPFFEIGDDAVMFRISTNTALPDSKRYRAYIAKSYMSTVLSSVRVRQTKVYNVTADNTAGAMVVTSDTIGKPVDEYSVGGVIHSISRSLTPDECNGLKVVIVNDKNYKTYYISDEEVLTNMNSSASFANPVIAPGDVIRFSADDDNIFEEIVLDFDYSSKTVLETSTSHNAICRYYYGDVYAVYGDKVSVIQKSADDISGVVDENTMRYVWRTSGIIPVFDTQTNEIYHSTAAEIRTYMQNGDNCSKLLVRTSNGTVKFMIVYK
ncbi:MAG: hypothetical protein J6B23_01055 [Clostridia bacterium]|nr:hypothetical protein [Clostridia bacterium]